MVDRRGAVHVLGKCVGVCMYVCMMFVHSYEVDTWSIGVVLFTCLVSV